MLRRNRQDFKADVLGVHYFALQTSVKRSNMLNYYRARAMQGCIHHVPAPVLQKKRKLDDDDDLLFSVVIVVAAICKRRR